MLRGVAAVLERHHRVLLLDEAIEAAVKLSHRYIPARQLPDKAVSLLDTACARVAVSQHAMPAEVEDAQRRIEALETEAGHHRARGRGRRRGGRAPARVDAKLAAEPHPPGGAGRARWQAEKAVVARVLDLARQLRGEGKRGRRRGGARPRRAGGRRPARAAQAASWPRSRAMRPLILPRSTPPRWPAVVADWTGIPVGRMVKNELEAVLNLGATLGRRVIGQQHALEMIARRIQTSRARLDNPDKPVGVFMLCGTSGVGKTETALALAEALYGGEQNVITINMSEFQEAHTVSTLKGAPPGYVGYGEGGVLTEAVRRRPYSVVLLDEVEKAHPDVHELFFQVFDKGVMEDGEGRRIDFRNTIILLTSNVGSELVMRACRQGAHRPDPAALAQALQQPLQEVFPPALLGRIVTIPYYPLSDEMLAQIVRLQLERIRRRVQEQHRVALAYGDDAVELIVRRCHHVEAGGRVIDSILTNTVLPRLSVEFLSRTAEGRAAAAGGAGSRRRRVLVPL